VTSPTPVVVVGLTGAVEIGAGSSHSCARISGGTLQCWGPNNQMGNGVSLGQQLTPATVVGLTGVTSLSAGDYTCVTVTGGGAKCWGINAYGRLGNGIENGTELTPVTVTGYTGSIARIDVADDGNATCAVLGDGTGVCWGRNFDRELGIDTEGRGPSFVPVVIGSTGFG
jgi:alpha-tubulin suppressor-like RCC1 family protein